MLCLLLGVVERRGVVDLICKCYFEHWLRWEMGISLEFFSAFFKRGK